MLQDFSAATIAVDTSRIADVIPILLQPHDRRVLRTKEPILGRCCPSVEGAIVAEGIRPASQGTDVETVSSPSIVGLPSCIGSLKKQIGLTIIIAHDKNDMARPACILAGHLGYIDP
jgi:hypothetical protein